ncbi:MAG: PBP1A family penicillin-binding protein [Candidatus Saccharimonas sp.]
MAKGKQPAHLGRYANLAGKRPASKSRSPRSSHKHHHFKWFWRLSRKKKILVLAAPVVLFLILTPLITYLVYANDIRDQERLMNRNNTGIVLTDHNGKPFYSIGKAEHRTLIPLTDISDTMEHALIASEDKDFYKHGGFNILSIIRAAFTGVGGGSTLTQQLAKNTVLSDQHSFLRKYQELAVAIAIEQNYTKDQILDMYLNSVYYGENSFGIEEAAKTYFGVAPKDLNLAQSAMLVGVLPAPSAYSPISGNPEYAKSRQTTVLSRMVTTGYITEDQKTAALAETLTYATDGNAPSSIAPHFVEQVINELSDKYGYENVMRSGFQVKTTLDYDAQVALNESVAAGMPHINANGGSNASGIVIDPTNGQVRAYVGSADYTNDKWGKVNMVTSARQPGSTMKPIYYSYALADGVITPASIFLDEKTDFGGGYTPQNADKKWHGNVTVRQALDWSLNIPSIKIMQKYGITKSVTAANKLGLGFDPNGDYNLTMAIGSVEAPLIKMANAYAAFANQGSQYATTDIVDVQDKFGKKIFTSSSSAKQVISKEGAYLISNILADNTTRSVIFGSSLTVPNYTVAVKTGTTNDNRDAWAIGYTPNYVVGVWVGNNDNAAMKSGGSDMAGPIWKNTMKKLLASKANTQFTMPSSIVQKAVCTSNGGLASSSGTGTYNEYFMAGALPTETCDPTPTMITVCNLETKKVESIDEKKYDSQMYSKNVDDCKAAQIEVCDLTTHKVVTIDESAYDSTKYSKDTSNCNSSGNSGNGNTTTPIIPKP